ncbi:uncharacterized protein LOC130998933 [Salvia miltiorrhiza]|uniref:uncharacterized protein LOC130998933 n=1 Tax=Salvia miltiorrhiza TaxID=226208 RepID=UPI0025AC0A2F|nr:uncharacterized protein LOC130998933 [Salvia miltiorrhiza]
MLGGGNITVRFYNVSLGQYDDVAALRCVRFAANGTLQLSNVTGGGGSDGSERSCAGRSDGHFSIVAPRARETAGTTAVKWWMIGAPGGAAAVVVIAAAGILWWRICRWRKMERIAERSEGLSSIWIGNSRMPTATGIRTQPNLENSYIP